MLVVSFFFFFFKQKTAYEMRISDWSSDVCSSDLRMAGILGRWGDGNEFSVVLDVLRTLYHQAGKVGSGTTGWLNLRSYPAVLVFTAYGIGLTKAARWSVLLKLFSVTLASEYREPQAIVSTLFLWSWKGGDQETWRQLAGFDRRKTPLTDHLLEVMERWRKSIVSVDKW